MNETMEHQTPFVVADTPEVLLQQSMFMIISQVALWEAIEKAMAMAKAEENPVPDPV